MGSSSAWQLLTCFWQEDGWDPGPELFFVASRVNQLIISNIRTWFYTEWHWIHFSRKHFYRKGTGFWGYHVTIFWHKRKSKRGTECSIKWGFLCLLVNLTLYILFPCWTKISTNSRYPQHDPPVRPGPRGLISAAVGTDSCRTLCACWWSQQEQADVSWGISQYYL